MITEQQKLIQQQLAKEIVLIPAKKEPKYSDGNGGNNDDNNDNGGDDDYSYRQAKPKIVIKVKCLENLFGNSNFTKGCEYKIRENNKDYSITTNFQQCTLPCNLSNNKASDKKNNICFGLCLFKVMGTYYVYEVED